MPLVTRADITDPVTPAKLEVVLKPIRILQINGKIDEENFFQEEDSSSGAPLHAGSLIRSINDLPDSSKIFDGKSIFTEADSYDAAIAGKVYRHFYNTSPLYDEKAFFEVHSKVCCALYTEEHTIRDIDFKLSYTKDDIKATFHTARKELKRLKKAKAKHEMVYPSREQYDIVEMAKNAKIVETAAQGIELLTPLAETVELSQSIEVEVPTSFRFRDWEIFGDLDWGWQNAEGEGDTEMSIGVLYVEVDKSRDDFVNFKLTILFDRDAKLTGEDYVLCAGKIQYRLRRYA